MRNNVTLSTGGGGSCCSSTVYKTLQDSITFKYQGQDESLKRTRSEQETKYGVTGA